MDRAKQAAIRGITVMGMTITEKILAAHSGRDSVAPGEIVNAKIDLIVAHDVTTPPAVQMLKKLGIDKVFDTTTMGALGTFASGIGSTDLAAALATGELWFKVPESMRFELKGSSPFGVYSKDIILYIISKIGVDGARYQAMEYCGDGLKSLTMEARFTITNMAIEAGGKSGIMPADETAEAYVKARTKEPYTIYNSDGDATYSEQFTIN